MGFDPVPPQILLGPVVAPGTTAPQRTTTIRDVVPSLHVPLRAHAVPETPGGSATPRPSDRCADGNRHAGRGPRGSVRSSTSRPRKAGRSGPLVRSRVLAGRVRPSPNHGSAGMPDRNCIGLGGRTAPTHPRTGQISRCIPPLPLGARAGVPRWRSRGICRRRGLRSGTPFGVASMERCQGREFGPVVTAHRQSAAADAACASCAVDGAREGSAATPAELCERPKDSPMTPTGFEPVLPG